MHVLENVYFVYICSIFSLHCFVQFAENKDIVLYCIVLYCIVKQFIITRALQNRAYPRNMGINPLPFPVLSNFCNLQHNISKPITYMKAYTYFLFHIKIEQAF